MSDVSLDLRLAKLAGAIYDDSSQWDFDFRKGDIRVGCLKDPAGVIVVPRGTEITNIQDILRDADCVPANAGVLGFLHRGFWLGSQVFAPAVDQFVGNAPIIGSGHSLGGALIEAYAAYRLNLGKKVAYLATFGCPKIVFSFDGDETPTQALLSETAGPSYAHLDDPIPPEPFFFGFYAGRAKTSLAQSQGQSLDPLVYHAIDGYIADVSKLKNST